MAQPDYVPVSPADRVRESEPMPPPKRWVVDRPGEIVGLRPPIGESFGRPGPDQGYALKLARLFEERLVLQPGEHTEDALAAGVGVALKRASIFGRAPVIYDLEIAFTLFGYLGDAPRDLAEWRKDLVETASHHYWDQREIADLVPDETLRMPPSQVKERARSGEWRALFAEGAAD